MIKEFAFLGHPDKFADLIADILVDRALAIDPKAKCAFEVMVKGNGSSLAVVVGGECSVDSRRLNVDTVVDVAALAANIATPPDVTVTDLVTKQSADIAANSQGVVGDQSVVVGMSVPRSHPLARVQRKELSLLPLLRGSRGWDGDGKAMFVGARLVSLSVGGKGFEPSNELEDFLADEGAKLNPPGRSTWAGGPAADCGMTNRKLACDAHGTYAPHGGGGLSGKDLSKPDRGGRLIADYLAGVVRDFVAGDAGVAYPVTVTLVYEMGNATPLVARLNDREFSTNAGFVRATEHLNALIRPYPELLGLALDGRPFSAVAQCHPWLGGSL